MSPVINRRSFLKGAAAAAPTAALLPLAGGFGLNPVFAAGGGPKRAIFFFIPDGCIPQSFHPSGSEFAFRLGPQTQALDSVRNDCVFLSGFRMYEGGNSHEGGVAKVLTGNSDRSLDVFLAEQLRGQTPISSLYLGIHATHENGNNYFSFLPGNKVRTPEDNPLKAFEQTFGKPGNSGGGGGGGGGAQAVDPRASVLDVSLGELQRLQNRLGSTERQKLDLHLTALREVEQRIKAVSSAPSTSASAGALSVDTFNSEGFVVPEGFHGYPSVFNREENFELVGKLQTDLAVLALANDVTRVVSIQWSHPVSPTQMAFTGSTQRHHDASHYGAPDSATARNFNLLQNYYCGQLASLINKLRSVPEGDGTLLENTIIFLFSELGDSNLHSHSNMPFILAGQAGGALPTGRLVNLPEEAHSKILVSIANAMGFNIDSFGFTGRGRGGVPGLLANS